MSFAYFFIKNKKKQINVCLSDACCRTKFTPDSRKKVAMLIDYGLCNLQLINCDALGRDKITK
jgi:hypothetical protein